jgi:SAM-dependent methyltransferase
VQPPGFRTAFSILRASSAELPLGPRAHVLGRFLTCPFIAVVDALPMEGLVLDVGAGHGVLARLAVEAGVRRVVAVEPDVRKLPYALRHPSVWWVCGLDTCVDAPFDAVVLCDVLYRVPGAERDHLLARLRDRLKPGGVLLLKDVDPSRRLKHRWNLLQEAVAIRRLGLTLGSGQTYETREAMCDRLERLGFVRIGARRIDRGYPHPHILYTAYRPR